MHFCLRNFVISYSQKKFIKKVFSWKTYVTLVQSAHVLSPKRSKACIDVKIVQNGLIMLMHTFLKVTRKGYTRLCSFLDPFVHRLYLLQFF